MKRAPNWTENESEILLQSPTISDANLHLKLPKRTVDAIQVVRQGIHAYHTGKNYSMLSKMMVNRLENEKSNLICPICEEPLK
jgi:sulfur relay (sulfurtransferase) DsrC/TusE family protein